MASRVTTTVCTIITLRELAHARVLMKQLAQWHPHWARHVLLVDRPQGQFDPAGEPFRVVEVSHLPLPDKQATLFYYADADVDAAVKPWFFTYLFDTCGFDRLIFLDARSWLEAPLAALERELDGGAPVVLAPHLLGELRDEKQPGEMDVLRWGVHDGAIVGMSRSGPGARELLSWWCTRTYRHALRRPEEGIYRDQRWLDLAAGRWPLAILRDPAYNVAYFNLSERELTRSEAGYRARGRPLVLFRFPGFDPEAPEQLSDADQRFGTRLPEAAAELARTYADALFAAGHAQFRNLPYAFSHFAGGAKVSAPARSLYQRDRQVRDDCGDDPFLAGPGPFNRLLADDPRVTRLMGEIFRLRPDLQQAFPDINGRDAGRFAAWFVASAGPEYGIGAEHVAPVAAALGQASPEPVPGPPPEESGPGDARPEIPEARPRAGVSVKRRASSLPLAFLRRAGESALTAGFLRAASGLSARVGARATARTERAVSSPRPLLEAARGEEPRPSPSSPPGLNVCGYVTADLGIGQAARSAGLAARAAGLDLSMIDFAIGTTSPKTDRSFASTLSERNTHSVNLVYVNADQFPMFRRAMGPAFFEGKRTIAYWHWELPEFPDRWLPSFEGVDEVWTPTRFVQNAVSAKSPVPVVLVSHAISLPQVRPSRRRFGLPERGFLFLTMYDLLSYQERKNPEATITAFRRAFAGSEEAALVVKVLNAEKCPAEMKALRASLEDLPRAVLLPMTLDRQDVYDLEATCDAFVSLHRSEGFGLGLAECMYLGKPVIATNWSGNSDFMTPKNSCPVDYELVELDRDHGPYEKGQVWADPDIDQAAWYMRALAGDPSYTARVGARARQTMHTDYSPESIGRQMRARLSLLGRTGFKS